MDDQCGGAALVSTTAGDEMKKDVSPLPVTKALQSVVDSSSYFAQYFSRPGAGYESLKGKIARFLTATMDEVRLSHARDAALHVLHVAHMAGVDVELGGK